MVNKILIAVAVVLIAFLGVLLFRLKGVKTLTGTNSNVVVSQAPEIKKDVKTIKIEVGGTVNPAELTVKPGETVRWESNEFRTLTVNGQGNLFASEPLVKSDVFDFEFPEAGRYSYTIAPVGTQGVVVVAE